jgi:hypothetical protein
MVGATAAGPVSDAGSLAGTARDSIAAGPGVERAVGSLIHSTAYFHYRDAAKWFHFSARIAGVGPRKPGAPVGR